MLMRSALEFPGHAEVFVPGLRKKLLAHLERYIDLRVKAGHFRRPKHALAAAAVLTTLDEQSVEDATLELIANSLPAF